MMKARIVKNIQYSQGLKIISEAIVKKKSSWFGIWRTYILDNSGEKQFYSGTKSASFGAIPSLRTPPLRSSCPTYRN